MNKQSKKIIINSECDSSDENKLLYVLSVVRLGRVKETEGYPVEVEFDDGTYVRYTKNKASDTFTVSRLGWRERRKRGIID